MMFGQSSIIRVESIETKQQQPGIGEIPGCCCFSKRKNYFFPLAAFFAVVFFAAAFLVDFFVTSFLAVDFFFADWVFLAVFPPKTLSQLAQNAGFVPVRTIGPLMDALLLQY